GGLTTHDEVEAQTNAALVARARQVLVVADGSKIGRVHLARIAGIDSVDELITDPTADPDAIDRLRARGLTVTVTTLPAPCPALTGPRSDLGVPGRVDSERRVAAEVVGLRADRGGA